MTYQDVIRHLLAIYVVGCGFAFLFSAKDGQGRTQVFFYAATIVLFDYLGGGQAKQFGWAWYFINAIVDWIILFSAYMIEARSSKPLAYLAFACVCLDCVFGYGSGLYHPLRGRWYFNITNALESLEVGVLIVWTGPILSRLEKASTWLRSVWQRIRQGEPPWTRRTLPTG